MRILMIGDSWGTGEFSYERTKGNHISHPGTEQYLKEAGHLVINRSCPADNNMRQLRLADEELSKRSFDKIVWFQTEPLRNIYRYTPFPEDRDHWENTIDTDDYDALVEKWFQITYDKAQRIHDTYQIKFIVIGGLNRLHPIIKNYSFYDHLIWSWSGELVGHTSPYNTHYHTGKFARDHLGKLDDKRMLDEIKACRVFEDKMEACDMFQYKHPNREAHRLLSVRLLDMLG